jgi:hypothetical protein
MMMMMMILITIPVLCYHTTPFVALPFSLCLIPYFFVLLLDFVWRVWGVGCGVWDDGSFFAPSGQLGGRPVLEI